MPKSIARRRPRVKLSENEIKRRLRLGDLRRLICDRCRGSVLPEGDDASRDYLRELLLPISLGPNDRMNGSRRGKVEVWGTDDRMLREIESWAPWMGQDEALGLIDEINSMPEWQRRPRAMTLGKRLNVPFGERARLGLRTIGPCDMTEAAMAAIRRQKGRLRDRKRRRSRGIQQRSEYLASHNKSRTKPWELAGMSRAKWYRQQRETGPRAINLTATITARTLVSEVKTREGSKECERLPTPTPAGQTGTCVNEMDWLGWTPELAAEVAGWDKPELAEAA